MANYLYKVTINKYNSPEVIENIHLVAENYLQASHIAEHYIFEQGKYPNTPVEVTALVRDMSVMDIVNSNLGILEEEIEDPFDISNSKEGEVMKFKHSCSNTIEVLDNGWEIIDCPDCKEEIFREDLENVGGIWVFVGSKKKRK